MAGCLVDLQVLTVNQVYEVLLKFWATKDWSQALHEAIPDRKKTELQEEGRKKTARPAEDDSAVVEEESKRQKASV